MVAAGGLGTGNGWRGRKWRDGSNNRLAIWGFGREAGVTALAVLSFIYHTELKALRAFSPYRLLALSPGRTNIGIASFSAELAYSFSLDCTVAMSFPL